MSTRLRRCLAAAAIAASAGACGTAADPTALVHTIRVSLRDSALGLQTAASPVFQVMTWQISKLTATLDSGTGTPQDFPFTSSGGCTVTDNIGARSSVTAQCGGNSGIILPQRSTTHVVVHLTITRMEGRYAERPDLRTGADYDGDGIPNDQDACKLVPDPGENPVGSDFTACSIKDSTTGAVIAADQDLDGVSDLSDNCRWYPNPADSSGVQADVDRDGIGDACERATPIPLPGPSLSLDCDATVTDADAGLVVDFGTGGLQGAMDCDTLLRSCTLYPDRVTLVASPASSAVVGSCKVVP